jgi:hypothetical protein
MWRTFTYFISLLFFLGCYMTPAEAQDTIPIPLKIRIGVEASGPAIYFTNKNVLNEEVFLAVDLNEKRSAFISAGYLNYKYSQYNYQYLNKGSFLRIGMDFNLLKPDKSQGKYYAGVGLRYGISRFTSEAPFIEKLNYWGTTTTSLSSTTYWGHFIEFSPGIRTEIFKNVSLGWSVSLRMLLYSGTGKDLRPVNFPGFGDGTKTVTTAMSYYIVINIPYKKIKAVLKKDAPEENDDANDTGTAGNNSQNSGIRH